MQSRCHRGPEVHVARQLQHVIAPHVPIVGVPHCLPHENHCLLKLCQRKGQPCGVNTGFSDALERHQDAQDDLLLLWCSLFNDLRRVDGFLAQAAFDARFRRTNQLVDPSGQCELEANGVVYVGNTLNTCSPITCGREGRAEETYSSMMFW